MICPWHFSFWRILAHYYHTKQRNITVFLVCFFTSFITARVLKMTFYAPFPPYGVTTDIY